MIAEVIVDIASNVDKVFDYIASSDTRVGDRVSVPFGNRWLDGYVLRLKEHSLVPENKLKRLGLTKDAYSVILPEFLVLNDKMKALFHLRNVDCIRLFVPSVLRSDRVHTLVCKVVSFSHFFDKKEALASLRANATKLRALIESIDPDEDYEVTALNKQFGQSAVNKLLTFEGVSLISQEKQRLPPTISKVDTAHTLTMAQQEIVDSILTSNEGVHLIWGVTGSGKTEVYMHIIEQEVKNGKTAIFLVPEISLTPQMFALFRARFKDNVAILHSGLSDGERYDEWKRIRLGEASIVVGARSAIFAPLQNVGVIILDEEHDSSYIAESNPRYSTHVVAKLRGEYNHCPVILGSATPSIDSFLQARHGQIVLHQLLNRVNQLPMPKIEIVNMCDEMLAGNRGLFSEKLKNELNNVVASDNQAILFLNRRGFSSYMICRECGYVPKCENCDVSLVYHKEDNQLKCHYCSSRYKAITQCPKCGSEYIRLGASGTQKVVEELRKLYPKLTILRLDVDTVKNKNDLNTLLDKFANTKPCVLVGTQMIAKGHDFPAVTLVGIIDADVGLHVSDFRATERTFQLITQVAGRAGRANLLGNVVLQTYTPNHYVYRFAIKYDYLGFFEKECNMREVTLFPPFAKIVRVLVVSTIEDEALSQTRSIYNTIKTFQTENDDEFLFCRAMAAPIKRIEQKFRYQIICRFKLDKEEEITNFIFDTVDRFNNPKVKTFVEINPSNMS